MRRHLFVGVYAIPMLCGLIICLYDGGEFCTFRTIDALDMCLDPLLRTGLTNLVKLTERTWA
ncbi:hypothetical protein ASPBRDRAFT_491396 [Aspergillus brasiliensis CBS 101740]|uniref:Uncharacterized protein n=1 Tax=Aspergillus brasiliensis (strain CBS 101740 / IMI 381727 / IBT 21946) TaxID=767769 RepID=A0A1L9UN63_ASPBC|nr:hypothetical protein ASPBRDRAFT_491396 [Aspergillus brasiliensis CBS 101740]